MGKLVNLSKDVEVNLDRLKLKFQKERQGEYISYSKVIRIALRELGYWKGV